MCSRTRTNNANAGINPRGGQEMLGHACRDAITYRPLIQFLETSLCVQPLISIPFTPPTPHPCSVRESATLSGWRDDELKMHSNASSLVTPRRPLRYPADAATRKRLKYAGMFRSPVESNFGQETLKKKLKKGLNCTTAGPFIRYAVQLLVKGALLRPFPGLTNSFWWSAYSSKLGLLPSLSCTDDSRLSRLCSPLPYLGTAHLPCDWPVAHRRSPPTLG